MSKAEAADKAAGEKKDPLAEKLKHSIFYEACTSEIKDDFAALAGCLKNGTGGHSKQEAAFLLWYHALDSDEQKVELGHAGVINACLFNLDIDEATPAEKSCCAGLLACIAEATDIREDVAKGKGAGSTATAVLHKCILHDAGDSVQVYSAKTLRLLAEDQAARSVLIRAMEQRLVYTPQYLVALAEANAAFVTQLAAFLRALLLKRDDLRGEAIQSNFCEALLAVLRRHKTEATACAAVHCLLLLAEDKESWPRMHAAGGIAILVDLLGPPPQSIMDYEREYFGHLIPPELLLRENGSPTRRKMKDYDAELASIATRRRAPPPPAAPTKQPTRHVRQTEPEPGSPVGEMQEGAATEQAPPLTPPAKLGNAKSTRFGGAEVTEVEGLGPDTNSGRSSTTLAAPAGNVQSASPTPTKQELPSPGTLLSKNTCGLKWGTPRSLATRSHAAGCLYFLAQRNEYCTEMDSRLATHRLATVLKDAMASPADSGKKKAGAKKKKGLALTPEQAEAATHVTGVLKFLSLINLNRYRIARLGTVPSLVQLYHDSPQLLLRRNAQVLLTNAAMLAENGQLLLEAQLPEEFLVPVPMRLTPEETMAAMLEFPGCGLTVRSYFTPADAGEPSKLEGAKGG